MLWKLESGKVSLECVFPTRIYSTFLWMLSCVKDCGVKVHYAGACVCVCVILFLFVLESSFAFVNTFKEWCDRGINSVFWAAGYSVCICCSILHTRALCHHGSHSIGLCVCVCACMSDWLYRNHRSGFIMHQKLILLSFHNVILFKVCYAIQPLTGQTIEAYTLKCLLYIHFELKYR